uniref:(California timema) hypothetical protein n=2 Tax=Timema TaxID=61471 RepID=A0A7R9PD44_TIMCA|nr:unnamed protein product [Timema californicum]
MEESPELSYKIIGAITHHGFTPNSGHYVADVFSFHQHSWYHYDDETAREKPEEDVLGHNLQCNGYVFFYMYRPLFDQMMSQRQESQDKDITVK